MAKIKLEIRPWLSDLINEKKESGPLVLEKEVAEGTTLSVVLQDLAKEHQKFGNAFYDPYTGQPSSSVAIVINQQVMPSLKKLDANLKDGDAITLMPFLDGG